MGSNNLLKKILMVRFFLKYEIKHKGWKMKQTNTLKMVGLVRRKRKKKAQDKSVKEPRIKPQRKWYAEPVQQSNMSIIIDEALIIVLIQAQNEAIA